MIKISVSEVKEFLKRSKSVKVNTILPILSYIKLDCKHEGCTLQKSNLNTYIIHQVEAEYQNPVSVLLDEKQLSLLAASTNAECFEISIERNQLQIKHGEHVFKHGIMDAVMFPEFPEAETKETAILSKAVLNSIGVAKNFTLKVEGKTQLSYLHLTNNMVVASNKNVVYWKEFETLPDLVLEEETCSIISQFESLQYFRSGNYDFFDTGKTLYGFIRPEETTPDFSPILNQFTKDEPFTVQKDALVSFCELSVGSTIMKGAAISTLKPVNGSSLQFEFVDESSVENKMVFKIEGRPHVDEFDFDSKVALDYFKNLPYKEITFSRFAKGDVFLSVSTKEDETFHGIFCGTVKN